MDIVIDIQGFRDVEENFIPKEVAVLAINAAITGHWIMTSPCPFEDLPVRTKRENNWLTRNYHGIEWFDGDVIIWREFRRLSKIYQISRTVDNAARITDFEPAPNHTAPYATLTN